MTEIIMSWPWYDRAMAGVAVLGLMIIPFVGTSIDRKLSRIIELLERRD